MGGSRLRVGILGASGYAGGELIRLLVGHPAAEIVFLGAKDSAGKRLIDVHPHLAGGRGLSSATLQPIDVSVAAERTDLVFSALPRGASAKIAPELLERGVRFVDLAGDFRLPAAAYPEWYGFDHPAPEWLGKAVNGLPELLAEHIVGAQLVANPGCFATAAILGLAPIVGAGLIDAGAVRIDGKTGLSGAGRGATERATLAGANDSIRPYRAPHHQHTPEIERGIELATGIPALAVLVPHLVPAVRGVLTTSYASLGRGATTETLTEALAAAYAGKPFVHVLAEGTMADSKRVRGTNVVELQAVADPRTGTAVIVGAIDNLVKGAAGQAIQNMNVALGMDEAMGLPTLGMYP